MLELPPPPPPSSSIQIEVREPTQKAEDIGIPNEDCYFYVVIKDSVDLSDSESPLDLTIKSMVHPQSAPEERDPEAEYAALYAIRQKNIPTYYTQQNVCLEDYCKARFKEAERFQRTPFSSFVIFLGDEIIGRLGIAQGYFKDQVDLEALKEAAPCFGISPEEVYESSNHEIQIGVLVEPEYYTTDLYLKLKDLAIETAEDFYQRGYQKPINENKEPYQKRPLAFIDRSTFTVIDATQLADDIPEEDRLLLEAKYEAAEKGCEMGKWQRLGMLLPQSIDPRNYSEFIRVVYGKNIEVEEDE